MNPWEILLERIRRARSWPIPSEIPVRRQIALWAALRESDEAVIRRVMEWKADRMLEIDNLPEKIAQAYGDLLFGESPEFDAATPEDAERETEMARSWSDELPAAEETNVSEGEVYWRLSLAQGIPHPVLTWHSRADVVPLLHGRNLLAAAFVSRLDPNGSSRGVVWRHLEIHGRGTMVNVLFRGRDNALGQMVGLDQHPQTADLVDRWDHGLDGMLCGRIVHKWGRKPIAGVSIYRGVWTRFLGINEATTIGRENMRLTAKKRAVVPSSAIRSAPARPDGSVGSIDNLDGSRTPIRPGAQFDAGEDVLVADPLDVTEGDSSNGPFKVLEYSFDAEALIAWLKFEIETACQRCDLVPQFIGSGDFGVGSSGTALRVRLLPTVNAAQGAARPWDGVLPEIGLMGQLLESLPVALGGLGREEWIDAGTMPSVERGPELPEDDNEVAQRQATLKTADLISTRQSIIERHPDWSEEQINEEIDAIRADQAATMPQVTPFGG